MFTNVLVQNMPILGRFFKQTACNDLPTFSSVISEKPFWKKQETWGFRFWARDVMVVLCSCCCCCCSSSSSFPHWNGIIRWALQLLVEYEEEELLEILRAASCLLQNLASSACCCLCVYACVRAALCCKIVL